MDKATVVFVVLWLAGMLVVWPLFIRARLRTLRARGQPLRPQPPPGAVYAERRASGRAKGQLGGASNCLLVAVAGGELWVMPIFPFSLIGGFGLEHRVPVREVVSAGRRRTWAGGNVVVTLLDGTVLELKVRDPDAFLAAMQREGGPRGAPLVV